MVNASLFFKLLTRFFAGESDFFHRFHFFMMYIYRCAKPSRMLLYRQNSRNVEFVALHCEKSLCAYSLPLGIVRSQQLFHNAAKIHCVITL